MKTRITKRVPSWFTHGVSQLTDIVHWLSETAGLTLNSNDLSMLENCSTVYSDLANILDILSPCFMNKERLQLVLSHPDQITHLSRLLHQVDRDCDTLHDIDLGEFMPYFVKNCKDVDTIISQFHVRIYEEDLRLNMHQLTEILNSVQKKYFCFKQEIASKDSHIEEKQSRQAFICGMHPRLGSTSSILTFTQNYLFDNKTLPMIFAFIAPKLYLGRNFYEKAACQQVFRALESNPVDIKKIKALLTRKKMGGSFSIAAPLDPQRKRECNYNLTESFFELTAKKLIQSQNNRIYCEILHLIVDNFNFFRLNYFYRGYFPQQATIQTTFSNIQKSGRRLSLELIQSIEICSEKYLSNALYKEPFNLLPFKKHRIIKRHFESSSKNEAQDSKLNLSTNSMSSNHKRKR